MKVKISLSVSKLGYQIPNISLAPQLSCRADAPCAKGCYGKKGHFLYKNVQASHINNYNVYKEDKDLYFNEIINYLTNGLISYKFFRWHTVGDIVDYDYLLGMIKVAKKCKNVKFLAFTKKYELVNEYLKDNQLPKNLRIIYSAWHKGWQVPNPYNMPVAYVFFKKENLNPEIPELAIPCQGHCEKCQACWNLKSGQSVFFHQH